MFLNPRSFMSRCCYTETRSIQRYKFIKVLRSISFHWKENYSWKWFIYYFYSLRSKETPFEIKSLISRVTNYRRVGTIKFSKIFLQCIPNNSFIHFIKSLKCLQNVKGLVFWLLSTSTVYSIFLLFFTFFITNILTKYNKIMSSLNKIKEFPYIFYCNFQRSKKYNNVQDGNIYIKFVHYQEQHRL